MPERKKTEKEIIEDAIKANADLMDILIDKKKVYGSRTEREDEAVEVTKYLLICLLLLKKDINGVQKLNPMERDRYRILRTANEIQLNKKLSELTKQDQDLDIDLLKTIRGE